MIMDSLHLLSDAQAISATGYSTNTIDTGTPARELGKGQALGVFVSVDVAADATTGDETYEFQIVDSANANLSSHNVLVSRTIARATLVAGFGFFLPLPPGAHTARYLGLRAVLGGTTPSITITAFLTRDDMIEARGVYADAITIS
jgi:hypothetical protein